MSSLRRILSSRANGAKSRGPKTPESKARSAVSNLRHGLLSRTILLNEANEALTEAPDPENRQSFASLLATHHRDLRPQDAAQRALVESLAISRWRLRRLLDTERSALQAEIEKLGPNQSSSDARTALAFRALASESRQLDLLNRYEAKFTRQYTRALERLLIAKASQPASRETPAFCHSNLIPSPDTPRPAQPAKTRAKTPPQTTPNPQS